MPASEHLRRNAANLEAVGEELLDHIDEMDSTTGDQASAITELQTNFNSLLAKLDADAGVTDTDYESTLAVGEEE